MTLFPVLNFPLMGTSTYAGFFVERRRSTLVGAEELEALIDAFMAQTDPLALKRVIAALPEATIKRLFSIKPAIPGDDPKIDYERLAMEGHSTDEQRPEDVGTGV